MNQELASAYGYSSTAVECQGNLLSTRRIDGGSYQPVSLRGTHRSIGCSQDQDQFHQRIIVSLLSHQVSIMYLPRSNDTNLLFENASSLHHIFKLLE